MLNYVLVDNCRVCYFTTAAVNKKVDFLHQINSTFGSGGLMCSLNDKELSQYVTWKKLCFHKSYPDREPKKGVLSLGKQKCGKIWIFSQNVAFNRDGAFATNHKYVWLKNCIAGSLLPKEIPLDAISCDINIPSTVPNADSISVADPTTSVTNPTPSAVDPTTSVADPTPSTVDPTTSIADPTPSAVDPTTSIADPTASVGDPNFETLLEILEDCLDHNYLSCLLMMGAGVACFHYQEIMKLFRFCPQVMATGPVSTGKSMSIQAALCLFGADNAKNHYIKIM